MISCQPKRSRESNPQYQTPLQRAAAKPIAPTRSAGGDYEGAEYSDNAPPLPVVSKVFHLAGTATAVRDQAKLIEEIRVKGKPTKKPVVNRKGSNGKLALDNGRSSSKSSVSNNDVGDNEAKKSQSAFKAVLLNRESEDDGEKGKENGLKVFDVVKTDLRAMDELDAEYRVGGSGDVVACNDAPMVLENVADGGSGIVEDYVYDLYYSTAEGPEAKLDLSFLDTYLDVKPYRNEDLDALENYGIVEPASMLERGFLGVEDEDSNDEDNWRNDYPDSDPEDTFDREEPDYDQCGFTNDAVDEDEYASPIGPGRDDYLTDMLRIGMRLRSKYGDDEEEEEENADDDEVDREDVDQWDVGNPKESQAYLEYKKRTVAQLKLRVDNDEDDDDDDVEDDDQDVIDVYGEGMVLGRREEKLNFVAYDEKLDKDSESDSFDNYDEDEDLKDI